MSWAQVLIKKDILKGKNDNSSKPLELKYKLYFFFIPFGAELFFTNQNDSSVLHSFHKYGYERKLKEAFLFSILGLLSYVVLILIIGFYFL